MLDIEISACERRLLLDHKRKSPLVLVRAKADAVLLASRGVDIDIIADVNDREPSTIATWLRSWRELRMGSIFTGHEGNWNASKLSPSQLARVKQALSKAPSESGIPGQFWSVPALADYMQVAFGVVYESESSYHLLLKFAGLSFKEPAPFDSRRDEAKITERMEEIKTEVNALLADPQYEVFAADEVQIRSEAIVRRAWLPVGERTRTKILVDRETHSASFIGFLNQRTGTCQIFAMEWQDSDHVLLALDRFLRTHPEKKIAIVWDNAPWHKSAQVHDALAKGGILERVHLIAMPPYAPDHNPIEHVWNTAKNQIANIQKDTFDQTIGAFLAHTDNQIFEYHF